ncbi:MAG: hypothetical protein SFV15_03080 [Polyangiaceae bacterium]|nr:hypothetical protein [Polyangiaceae bacterium]
MNDLLVELTESEAVTPHGTQKVVWFVWFKGCWTHPKELDGTVCESLERASGTVWAQRLKVPLPEGARLMKVDQRPNTQERLNPLDYLTREVRGARQKTHRRYYRVSRNGTLVMEPVKPTSPQ